MSPQTKVILDAALKADSSITPEQRRAAMAALAGSTTTAHDRLVSRSEAARLLNVSPHCVSAYLRRGLLTAARLGPKGKLATGILVSSIRKLLEERTRATA